MNKRTVTNKEELIERIQEAMTFDEEAKYYYRLTMLMLFLNDMEVGKIAKMFNESPTTIWYWVKKGIEEGIEDLISKEHTGRKARLTKEQETKIEKALESPPRESGYAYENWDGIILSRYIGEEIGITLEVRQCQRLMRKLGFSKQRPRTISGISDAEAREEFKKN